MKKFFSLRPKNFLPVSIIAVIVSSLLFVACSDDDDAVIPVARLMAFNLAPDKTNIGIALSGNALTNAPLAYTNYTGSYLNIFTGNRPVQAYDYGSSTSFTSSNYNFADSAYYSLFVIGANNNYSNLIVEDDYEPLSGSSGNAYIRYINAIPDSSDPQVTITAGATPILQGPASYAHVSAFTAATPGSVTIDVDNGTNINVDRTITVEARKVYTVLLLGVPGQTGNQAVQIKFIENGTLDAND